jgi:hypothetical protein
VLHRVQWDKAEVVPEEEDRMTPGMEGVGNDESEGTDEPSEGKKPLHGPQYHLPIEREQHNSNTPFQQV